MKEGIAMNCRRFLFTLTCFLIVLGTIQGATIYVPDDYPSIQEAVFWANAGDTVIVRPGTYKGTIDFLGQAITVTSESGPEVTVIDGTNEGSVVSFVNSEGPDTLLEGFTLTNGSGTVVSGYLYGGGIYCSESSPTIRNNVITGNSAYEGAGICLDFQSDPKIINNKIVYNSADYGAGISCLSSSPEISNNTISWNTAASEGGGLLCSWNCSPMVDGNTFQGNSAGVFGGGLEFWNGCSPVITNNIIIENKAIGNSGGGVIISLDCSGIVANNIIAWNTSTLYRYGGGISIDRDSEAEIINNIIYGNRSHNGGGIDLYENSTAIIKNNTIFGNSAVNGGGIMCRIYSTAVIVNSILWDNRATTGPEIFLAGNSTYSTIDISYSDVKGGNSSVFVGPNPLNSLIWGSGMIETDPLFAQGPCGLHYLSQVAAGQATDSPCVDSGSDLASNVGMDAYFTRTDEVPDSDMVDMGYHYGPFFYPSLQVDVSAIPVTTGGTVNHLLLAGAGNANRNYLLLGGVTGTNPGTPLPGGYVTLLLNWDVFTDIVLANINGPLFSNFMGKLNADGRAKAQLFSPPLPSVALGVNLYFAYCCNNPFDFASNSVTIEIAP